MKTCTNKGCGKQFSDEKNADDSCVYHPAPPIFHEGMKGWGCCSKRVLTFEEFLEIPGCQTGKHSDHIEPVVESASKDTPQSLKENEKKVEVYETGEKSIFSSVPMQRALQDAAGKVQSNMVAAAPSEQVEDEDPEGVQIDVGAVCKRNGCGYAFKSNSVSQGTGVDAVCTYHPGVPVFHEGSKGWSCCSRKVLEFDEFLKIKGCKSGNHVFVGTPKEVFAECRHDWYQSPSTLTLSIYAKQVDPAHVDIKFEKSMVKTLEFTLPNTQKYRFHTALFQPIVPEECNFKVMSSKVEIILKKTNGISWPSLEPTADLKTWTTFGITGRTGTVGSKEMHLSQDSPLLALQK